MSSWISIPVETVIKQINTGSAFFALIVICFTSLLIWGHLPAWLVVVLALALVSLIPIVALFMALKPEVLQLTGEQQLAWRAQGLGDSQRKLPYSHGDMTPVEQPKEIDYDDLKAAP